MAWALPDDCVLGIVGERREPAGLATRLAARWGVEVAAVIHQAMLKTRSAF